MEVQLERINEQISTDTQGHYICNRCSRHTGSGSIMVITEKRRTFQKNMVSFKNKYFLLCPICKSETIHLD